VAKDGTVHWMKDNARPIKDEQGRVVRIIGAAAEISDLKHIEEELRISHDELEEQVWRRTVDLEKNITNLQAEVNERKQAQDELAGYREHLEELVQERTAQLNREIDERKKTEKKLRESEERLNAFFGQVPGGLNLLDGQFRYQKVNELAARYMGLPMEEIIGKSIGEIAPKYAPEAIKIFRTILDTGEPVRGIELSGEFPEHPGETTWWLLTYFPITIPGEKREIGIVAVDITERKRAEKALAESEKRYRIMGESVDYGVWAADGEGKAIYTSSSFCEMVGRTCEQILEFGWLDRLVPEQREEVIDLWTHSVRTEEPFEHEHHFIDKDGQIHIVLARGKPVRDERGKIVSWAGINLDITDRKHAEDVLLRYELLSTYSRDIILYLREDDWHIMEANLAAVNAYGYSREELLSMTIQDLRSPDTRGLTEVQIAEAYENGIIFETVHRRKDGSTFPVEVSSGGALIDGVRTFINIIRDITDRKRIEKEIEWMSRFPEENPYPVMRVSSEGKILYANSASTVLLEEWHVRPGDLLPKPWQEVIQEIMQTGKEQTREVVCCERIYSVNFAPVPGKDYINMHASEITERKRAEESLRESERRYRELFETMQEALFVGEAITDEQGHPVDWRFIDVNPAVERFMEMTREQFVEHTYREVVAHPDQGWIDLVGEVALTGESVSQERYAPSRGRWLHLNAYSPRPGQAAVLFTDITERKQAEEALRERDARFSTLINNLSTGVALIDDQGCFAVVNPEFLRIFGLPEIADIMNVNSIDWGQWQVFNEDGALLHVDEHPVRKAALTGHPVNNQVVAVKRPSDQVTVWLSISVTQLFASGNTPGQFVITYNDITGRRRAEERTRELNDHLSRKTAQLEAANKELEAFSYSISHDLRAPLRTLDGFSTALLEDYSDRLDPEGQNYLNRIRAAAQRMARLIDDLLQLSRTTRAEIHYTTVNLSNQAQYVLEELRQAEPERKVEVSIQEGMTAEGDETLLRQVLQNLLGNAWKFTSHKENARIEFGEKRENARQIFFVRDNGAGFDMRYAENLYVPFRRLHSDTDFPGTGIGLSIVKRIIDRHGGEIWAESEPGKGATFYFTLGE
ncbi:MAG: PAS domain S-box protein, partial [Candidatus Latescibacterota bacterium]